MLALGKGATYGVVLKVCPQCNRIYMEESGEEYIHEAYIFVVGYCAQCQKYYMDIDDYNVIYPIGRPEVTIISDLNESDYQITSGEVFNLEKNHLEKIESGISGEIEEIHGSSDYVNPYAVGDYDDGNLSFAKSLSANKYGKRLEELENYIPKPYSYRVDITADGETETYYIGAADVVLKDGKKVISANSDLGYELINYQTIKVHKDGKEYSIKLSRQFDIDHASLYGYTNLRTDEDVIFQSGITDPFLVRVLNMRKKQHSLTDIFVTIQENQNKIVNTDFKKNIIVQGCAGSGKTMVLLHRLSALKYKQRYPRFYEYTAFLLILQPCKKIPEFAVKDFFHCNQLTDLDVHPVGFQLCIRTLGYLDSHQVHFCNHLVLGKFPVVADFLYISANIQIRS